jgi:apolipoprotein N-acyltransferase
VARDAAGVGALVWLVARALLASRRADRLAVGCGAFFRRQQLDRAAFTYQAKMPGWLGGIAVVLLSLYLALFPALAAGASWFVRRAAGAGAGLCGGVDRQRMVAFMAVHRLCVEPAGRGAAGR